MRGFSSALLLLRQLPIVVLKEYYFILWPQQSIYAQIKQQELYRHILPFISSHCTFPSLYLLIQSLSSGIHVPCHSSTEYHSNHRFSNFQRSFRSILCCSS